MSELKPTDLNPPDCLIVIEATPQMDGTWWVGGSTFLDDSAALKWLPDTPETRGTLLADTVLRARIDALRAELEAARVELGTVKAELNDTRSRLRYAENMREQHLRHLTEAEAELAAERGRLDFLITESVHESMTGGQILLLMKTSEDIPVGQTAREVIDRLRGEDGDAG